MKFVKYLLIAITSIIFISACQKELDFTLDGLAHGGLKSASTGDCNPSAVNGIYKADSLLDNTNFIDVQVNLNATGTYDIKSDTVNGYSFRGNGTLGATGINTVRLYASGKPLVAGIDNFTIVFDTSICTVSVSVIGANTGIAVYTLSGSPALCTNAHVNGTYTEGVTLDISNTVTLMIDVVDTGVYTIAAASANGMVFTASGTFTTFGTQAVTLNGAGTPQTSGTINVAATNIATTCNFTIDVLPSGSSTAVYSLDLAGANCSGATYSGTYTEGVPLTGSNAVVVNVTVTTIGTYNITTNTVNGMTFTGSGTFTVTGPQQPVMLVGSGTPTAAGVFNFTATAGTSNCTFSITVDAAPVNLDYLLLTPYSNFSQRLVGGAPSDTLYIRVGPNPITLNSNSYTIYQQMQTGAIVDSSYYRKNGSRYFNLLNTQTLGFDNSSQVDFLMLDSSVAIGGSLISDLGINALGGLNVTIKATGDILDKGATAVIAGNTYTNVIKVHYIFSYNDGSTNINFQENEIWFAKGKGFIYFKVNDLPVTTTAEEETTRIQVF